MGAGCNGSHSSERSKLPKCLLDYEIPTHTASLSAPERVSISVVRQNIVFMSLICALAQRDETVDLCAAIIEDIKPV